MQRMTLMIKAAIIINNSSPLFYNPLEEEVIEANISIIVTIVTIIVRVIVYNYIYHQPHLLQLCMYTKLFVSFSIVWSNV